MVGSAALVLDAQAEMLDRLGGRAFARALQTMVAHHVSRDPLYDERTTQRAIDAQAPAIEMLKGTLKTAYAYRVTPDMCQMVEYAAAQLDGTDQFDPSLAPTGCGIVRFESGLRVTDIRGKTMLIHWLIWGPGQFRVGSRVDQGTCLWQFNDTEEPDEVQEHLISQIAADRGETEEQAWTWYRRAMGHWATVGIEVVVPGQRMGPALWDPSEEQTAAVRAEGFEPVPGTNSLRLVHALWLLMNQTVARVEPEEMNRPLRRRMAKAQIPGRVSVIKLRREEGPPREPGESGVEWSHRWPVRGHWAWRTCSEHHPQAQPYKGGWGVRVWINPYLKGPADKPLVLTEKVYSLER